MNRVPFFGQSAVQGVGHGSVVVHHQDGQRRGHSRTRRGDLGTGAVQGRGTRSRNRHGLYIALLLNFVKALDSPESSLVEGKNGSIIRKHMGYGHIEQRHAQAISAFYRDFFVPYINFHRPCGFATLFVDRKGKYRRKYKTYQTPYEKLRSLPKAKTSLRPTITFDALDAQAKTASDNQAADLMQKEKLKLFASFRIRINTSQNSLKLQKGA
jgi:hypothetical protein